MAIPASISSSTSLWQQSQVQQTRRAADQATQAAQSLQAQARDARAAADHAEADARALEGQANQAQAAAAQISLSAQSTASFLTSQASSSDVYTVLPKAVSLNNQPPTQIPTSPANPSSTGQIVGTVINTIA
ncbi:hypothetical protein [Sideroxydans lithotrophicus]|uniref:hypothetical protein n=1 Tax=Sideroxydans lithotrophicus TaxID=63745 RepID=UPI00059D8B01|nr:hypothetical protein [Sideroxydans lithotrophicus]